MINQLELCVHAKYRSRLRREDLDKPFFEPRRIIRRGLYVDAYNPLIQISLREFWINLSGKSMKPARFKFHTWN